MTIKIKVFAFTLFVFIFSSSTYGLYAATLNVPSPVYSTIQSCLDAAQPGDTCLIAPGLFVEEISFPRPGTEGNLIRIKAQFPYSRSVTSNRTVVDGKVILKAFTSVEGLEVINHGIVINGNNTEVLGNYVHGTGDKSAGTGVLIIRGKPYFSNVLIRDNDIEQVTYGLSLHCSENCIIENNAIERLYTSVACRPSGACAGDVDHVRMFGNGIFFRGNTIQGSSLSEIDEDAHVDGIQSFNNGGLGGQGRDTLTNTVIENNWIQDSHQAIWWTSGRSTFEGQPMLNFNVTIRNNVFLNTWKSGARMAIGGPNSDEIYVYNNIFGQSVRVTVRNRALVYNNVIFGNFMNTGEDRFEYPQNAYEIKNNIFFYDGWLNKGLKNYPDIVATNHLDPDRSLIFENTSLRDYRLKQGSLAIDAGIDLSKTGFDYDHFGGKRPIGSGWDIGFHEYGSVPTKLPKPNPIPPGNPGTGPVNPPPSGGNPGTNETLGSLPTKFLAFKNTFNPVLGEFLNIRYQIEDPTSVKLVVYDRTGGEIRVIENATAASAVWDGKNKAGSVVAVGMYVLKLTSAGSTDTRKVILIK